MRTIICNICGLKNSIFSSKCMNCGSLIREKYSNINLGDIIKNLLIDTELGIKQILFSEHKNYLLIFYFIMCLKLTYISLFKFSFLDLEIENNLMGFIFNLFIFWIVFIYFIAYLLKISIHIFFRSKIKIKDSFSLIIYPGIYVYITILILIPIEFMIFGQYLFSDNPSILDINFTKAFILISIESIILLHAIFLLWNFFSFLFESKILAIISVSFIIILLHSGNQIFENIMGIN